MEYRILTDAFGKPMFLGGVAEGGPVWVSKNDAWLFDEDSAVLIAKHLPEITLDQNKP